MNKTFAPHVTSLLSAAGAAAALIHPGFTLPPFVQGLSVTVCALAAVGMQAFHIAKKNNLQTNLTAAIHFATQMAQTAKEDLVTETPKA